MPDKTNDTAGVIAPPPLMALGTLLAGLLIDWMFPAYVLAVLLTRNERLLIGIPLAAVGLGIGIAGRSTFVAGGTEVNPYRASTALVTGGIFEWLRNPMYVGLGFMTGGLGIAFGSDWTLVLMVPMALLLHFGVVKREERYLDAKFGEAYRAYMLKVPRYGWPF